MEEGSTRCRSKALLSRARGNIKNAFSITSASSTNNTQGSTDNTSSIKNAFSTSSTSGASSIRTAIISASSAQANTLRAGSSTTRNNGSSIKHAFISASSTQTTNAPSTSGTRNASSIQPAFISAGGPQASAPSSANSTYNASSIKNAFINASSPQASTPSSTSGTRNASSIKPALISAGGPQPTSANITNCTRATAARSRGQQAVPPTATPAFCRTSLRKRPPASRETCAAAARIPSKSSTRPLFWAKLPPVRASSSSLWRSLSAGAAPVSIDAAELERLFAKATSKPGAAGLSDPRGNLKAAKPVSTALSAAKAQNIGIVLSFLKTPHDVICANLVTLSGFSLSEVEGISSACPTAGELAAITDEKKSGKDAACWGPPEHFAYRLSKVPRLEARLAAWKTVLGFAERLCSAEGAAHAFDRMCGALLDPRRGFATVLRTVLAVGNVLNSGTRYGNAQGFRLSTLHLLFSMKAVDGTTLLEYVIRQLIRDCPEALEFTKELRQVTVCCKKGITAAAVTSDVQELLDELSSVEAFAAAETNCDETLDPGRNGFVVQEKIRHFVGTYKPVVTALLDLRPTDKVRSVAVLYGEDAGDFDEGSFFQAVSDFAEGFHEHHAKIREKLLREKAELAKIEEEKRRCREQAEQDILRRREEEARLAVRLKELTSFSPGEQLRYSVVEPEEQEQEQEREQEQEQEQEQKHEPEQEQNVPLTATPGPSPPLSPAILPGGEGIASVIAAEDALVHLDLAGSELPSPAAAPPRRVESTPNRRRALAAPVAGLVLLLLLLLLLLCGVSAFSGASPPGGGGGRDVRAGSDWPADAVGGALRNRPALLLAAATPWMHRLPLRPPAGWVGRDQSGLPSSCRMACGGAEWAAGGGNLSSDRLPSRLPDSWQLADDRARGGVGWVVDGEDLLPHRDSWQPVDDCGRPSLLCPPGRNSGGRDQFRLSHPCRVARGGVGWEVDGGDLLPHRDSWQPIDDCGRPSLLCPPGRNSGGRDQFRHPGSRRAVCECGWVTDDGTDLFSDQEPSGPSATLRCEDYGEVEEAQGGCPLDPVQCTHFFSVPRSGGVLCRHHRLLEVRGCIPTTRALAICCGAAVAPAAPGCDDCVEAADGGSTPPDAGLPAALCVALFHVPCSAGAVVVFVVDCSFLESRGVPPSPTRPPRLHAQPSAPQLAQLSRHLQLLRNDRFDALCLPGPPVLLSVLALYVDSPLCVALVHVPCSADAVVVFVVDCSFLESCGVPPPPTRLPPLCVALFHVPCNADAVVVFVVDCSFPGSHGVPPPPPAASPAGNWIPALEVSQQKLKR
ncbi:Formin-like protein 5 [Diplonema papillatum]|nr:Formin-like protein 5 [Diplonema papillatum]